MEDRLKSSLRHHLPSWPFIAATIVLLLLIVTGFVYFGTYDIAADSPHIRPVYVFLQTVRDRSIAVRARNIAVPADLADSQRISTGAGLYSEMCSGCHLGPGVEKSELSQGLYPQAPELARGSDLTPAQQFWIIKHGVKLSAMPAWGKTHNDTLIWDMVAFIDKLPKMSPQEYKVAVASAPGDHDEMMKDMPMMDKDTPAKDEGKEHGHH